MNMSKHGLRHGLVKFERSGRDRFLIGVGHLACALQKVVFDVIEKARREGDSVAAGLVDMERRMRHQCLRQRLDQGKARPYFECKPVFIARHDVPSPRVDWAALARRHADVGAAS